jgi:hypothetical protein
MHAADNVRHATCTTQRATINDAQRMRRMQRATHLLGATHYNACNAQPLTPVGSRRRHLSVYIVYIYSAACLRRVPRACAECNGLTHTPAAFGCSKGNRSARADAVRRSTAYNKLGRMCLAIGYCNRCHAVRLVDYTGCVTDHCRRSPTRARCRCRCKLRCGRAGCSTRRFG